MSTRYIVPNCDRFGNIVEVFTVTEFFNIMEEVIFDPIEAVSCVASDGTCYHAFDLRYVPIYTVH